MIWLVTFLAFNSGWSQNIFTSFFGVYLSQENGVSLTTAGQLVVLIGVLSVTSGMLWGRMSDQTSRSQAFFYSFLLQGVAFVLMAALPGMPSFVIAGMLLGITLRSCLHSVHHFRRRLRVRAVLSSRLWANVRWSGPWQRHLTHRGQRHSRQHKHELDLRRRLA